MSVSIRLSPCHVVGIDEGTFWLSLGWHPTMLLQLVPERIDLADAAVEAWALRWFDFLQAEVGKILEATPLRLWHRQLEREATPEILRGGFGCLSDLRANGFQRLEQGQASKRHGTALVRSLVRRSKARIAKPLKEHMKIGALKDWLGRQDTKPGAGHLKTITGSGTCLGSCLGMCSRMVVRAASSLRAGAVGAGVRVRGRLGTRCVWLQGGEVVGRSRGLGGRVTECARVRPQQGCPGCAVGGVVRVGCAREAEVCQHEGGAEFSCQLLGGVGAGAEPGGEVAGEPVGGRSSE